MSGMWLRFYACLLMLSLAAPEAADSGSCGVDKVNSKITAALQKCELHFPSLPAACGRKLAPSSQTGRPDRPKADGVKNDALYVLLMVDPDAPSNSGNVQDRNYLHWIVANIQGSTIATGASLPANLFGYKPPTPPAGTGLHRYRFLLVEQVAPLKIDPSLRSDGFAVSRFLEQNELCKSDMFAFYYTASSGGRK